MAESRNVSTIVSAFTFLNFVLAAGSVAANIIANVNDNNNNNNNNNNDNNDNVNNFNIDTGDLDVSRHLAVPALSTYIQWKMEDDHT